MRRWTVLGGLLLAAMGAGPSLIGPDPASGSCVAALTWRGHGYLGVAPEHPDLLTVGERIHPKAKEPPCIDVLPAPKPPPKPRRVAAFGYEGIPPELGFHAEGALWAAGGYFPELPDHPLHAALYGAASGAPDATTLGRCGGSRTVRGRVNFSSPGLQIDPAGKRRRLELEVDAATTITGFSRNGYPYLKRGDRVVVSGISCFNKDFYPSHFLVARSIAPL